VAAAHASLAVTNALLGTRRRVDRLVVPRVVFTDPEVAHVGADTWAERGARPPRTITRTHDHVDRAIAEARTDGFSRLALDRRGSRIIGATLVSPRAGESVAALTLAIQKGMSPTALAATMHAYPTYNDGPWTAAVEEIRRRLGQPGARRAVGALLAGRRAQWRHTPRQSRTRGGASRP
jgi:pyruvate/2-oxoglutarate dehydrogenase complex dihydrolipoamide dehydrogenase (E3) component